MPSQEILETERLLLRRPRASDWDAARDFYTSERARGVGGPFSIGRAWRGFAAMVGHWELLGCGMWCVTPRETPERVLGAIGPWTPADWPEKEVGWMIWEAEAEGKGIATEAARAAIHHVFAVLGWNTAVSYIAPENHRSIRLAEKLGARLDRKALQPEGVSGCLVYRHPPPALNGGTRSCHPR